MYISIFCQLIPMLIFKMFVSCMVIVIIIKSPPAGGPWLKLPQLSMLLVLSLAPLHFISKSNKQWRKAQVDAAGCCPHSFMHHHDALDPTPLPSNLHTVQWLKVKGFSAYLSKNIKHLSLAFLPFNSKHSNSTSNISFHHNQVETQHKSEVL